MMQVKISSLSHLQKCLCRDERYWIESSKRVEQARVPYVCVEFPIKSHKELQKIVQKLKEMDINRAIRNAMELMGEELKKYEIEGSRGYFEYKYLTLLEEKLNSWDPEQLFPLIACMITEDEKRRRMPLLEKFFKEYPEFKTALEKKELIARKFINLLDIAKDPKEEEWFYCHGYKILKCDIFKKIFFNPLDDKIYFSIDYDTVFVKDLDMYIYIKEGFRNEDTGYYEEKYNFKNLVNFPLYHFGRKKARMNLSDFQKAPKKFFIKKTKETEKSVWFKYIGTEIDFHEYKIVLVQDIDEDWSSTSHRDYCRKGCEEIELELKEVARRYCH